MKKALLSIGLGYSASLLARMLLPQGWVIYGTTRMPNRMNVIGKSGVIPLIFPSSELSNLVEAVDNILVSAAPTECGDPVLAVLKDQLEVFGSRLNWVGYLSTTGVYGDHSGNWVDERTSLVPTTDRGKWRQFAEQQWQAIPDLPIHIFRLAGIYGPGRSPFAKLRYGKSKRIIKKGQVFNRIHVGDIAQVLAASIQRPTPGEVYNISDDEPAPPQDVIAFAAKLLGIPIPPEICFDEAHLSPMARSFFSDNKRVSNSRMKKQLNISLLYPNYRIGLRQLFNDGN
ncbi:MAG: SDR family oxidoreductase [Aestuariivita sp.]|nr:SDR family oxidoreductase [Aestuariivita sp.]